MTFFISGRKRRFSFLFAVAVALSLFGFAGYTVHAPAKLPRAEQTEWVSHPRPKSKEAFSCRKACAHAGPAVYEVDARFDPALPQEAYDRLFSTRMRMLEARGRAFALFLFRLPYAVFPRKSIGAALPADKTPG